MYGTNSRSVSRSLSPASGRFVHPLCLSDHTANEEDQIYQTYSNEQAGQPAHNQERYVIQLYLLEIVLTQSLKDHAYALPKLGALEVDLATNFIIHVLQPSDTVAGLALTYGVTVCILLPKLL